MSAENASTEDVSEIIDDLRLWFGAKTDGELAKALRLDPSSISNWRRRGTVPKAYREILTGEIQSAHFSSREKWSDVERNAFAVALYWFATSQLDLLKDGGFPARLAFLTHADDFWRYANDAVTAIVRMQQSGRYTDAGLAAAFVAVTDYPPDGIKADVRTKSPPDSENK